jgi:hypothetical protein
VLRSGLASGDESREAELKDTRGGVNNGGTGAQFGWRGDRFSDYNSSGGALQSNPLAFHHLAIRHGLASVCSSSIADFGGKEKAPRKFSAFECRP